MTIIVGLGNPGKKYERSRHNAGFIFLDRLVERFRKMTEPDIKTWKLSDKFDTWHLKMTVSSHEINLLKPNTFMNKSGTAVFKFMNWFKDEEEKRLVLAYDDLDLPLGEFKIGENYPKSHNGVLSVVQSIGSGSFISIRLGTNNRDSSIDAETTDYVLQPMKEDELVLLNRAIDAAIIDFEKYYPSYLGK